MLAGYGPVQGRREIYTLRHEDMDPRAYSDFLDGKVDSMDNNAH